MRFFGFIFLTTLVFELILYVIVKHQQWKKGREILICSLFLMNTVVGIGTRIVFCVRGGEFYDFMAFGEMQIRRMLPISLIISAVLCILIIIFYYWILDKDKSAIISIRDYKFVPVQSIKNFILITGWLYLTFSIADLFMPQYAYWKIEDQNLNYMTIKHVESRENLNIYGYPLVNANVLDEMEPEDTIILVIGDSFIFGDGTSNVNNLWWRALQRKIYDKGYSNCKIVAVGMGGASTQDELFWLSETSMLEDIDPDMIIIGYVTNDAQYYNEDGILEPGRWAPEGHLEKGFLKYMSMVFPNIAYKIDNDLKSREIEMTDLSEQNLYEYSEWENQIIAGDNLIRYQKVAVEPLGEFLQELTIPYCLMTTPNTPDFDKFSAQYENVLPLFEEAGIPVYDCLDDFFQNHSKNKEYFKGINPVNGHPGIATNAYLADYAVDMIEKHYPAVLGQKDGQAVKGIVINDWMPFNVLKPSAKEDIIEFTYSDDWDKESYLYLPMFTPTVKICFENAIDTSGFVLKDENGNFCDDFEIWVSCIGNQGYESFIKKKLTWDGNVYQCDYSDITSLNIHRVSKGEGEKIYTIEVRGETEESSIDP